MKPIPDDSSWEDLSPARKQRVHESQVAEARAYLETLMREVGLSEEVKQRLRKAFPGTDKGGMKQAVAIEKRMAARNRQCEERYEQSSTHHHTNKRGTPSV
jgi:hypothetical protein